MDFKIGDRVSFLNEKGGGVIVSIRDKNTVVVSEDDGFSTPYAIKSLVKVNKPAPAVVGEIQMPTASPEIQQISLLFVPKDNTHLMDSDLDLQLVNNAGSNFYFELYYFEGQHAMLFATGQLVSGMTQLIKTIKRAEIEVYCKLRFQCLFNSVKKMEPMHPFEQLITIKPSRFYKHTSFTFSKFINNMAFTCTLALQEDLERLKQRSLEVPDAFAEKEFSIPVKQSKPNHYLRVDEEIDLHISEILENQMGMSSMHMLQIQLNLFKKELEKAIQLNYASITFIHGVGKGVLKESILKELEGYKGIKYYPASFQKYGNGATKVEIF